MRFHPMPRNAGTRTLDEPPRTRVELDYLYSVSMVNQRLFPEKDMKQTPRWWMMVFGSSFRS